MTNEQKLQKFAEHWMPMVRYKDKERFIECLTALISENYVDKDIHDRLVERADELTTELEELKLKYDELLQQRDELRERCKKLEFMIEKGLGWDDVKNDISMPHEL